MKRRIYKNKSYLYWNQFITVSPDFMVAAECSLKKVYDPFSAKSLKKKKCPSGRTCIDYEIIEGCPKDAKMCFTTKSGVLYAEYHRKVVGKFIKRRYYRSKGRAHCANMCERYKRWGCTAAIYSKSWCLLSKEKLVQNRAVRFSRRGWRNRYYNSILRLPKNLQPKKGAKEVDKRKIFIQTENTVLKKNIKYGMPSKKKSIIMNRRPKVVKDVYQCAKECSGKCKSVAYFFDEKRIYCNQLSVEFKDIPQDYLQYEVGSSVYDKL